jgi:hypothetical protein
MRRGGSGRSSRYRSEKPGRGENQCADNGDLNSRKVESPDPPDTGSAKRQQGSRYCRKFGDREKKVQRSSTLNQHNIRPARRKKSIKLGSTLFTQARVGQATKIVDL